MRDDTAEKRPTVKLARSLWDSPIESICALVLVAVGVYISSVGSSASENEIGLLAAGGLLTTFGGVLFAWVVSKAVTTERARSEFQQQLGHLSRNLGQAAGQISLAVEQSQVNDISSETGLALISQANRMIYGQVSEISVIQGTGFDPAYLLETVTTLDGLARRLESDGKAAGELDEVRQQLKEVRSSLRGAQPPRTFSIASVDCPECAANNEVELGDFQGDTASPVCVSCGKRFNAHRASNGSAFSRPFGPAAPRAASSETRWDFTCPACGHKDSAREGAGKKTMACFHCHVELLADLERHSVVLGDEKFRSDVVPIVGQRGSRPVVQCPDCEVFLTAFRKLDDRYLGVCSRDRRVLEVPCSRFEAWKATGSRRDAASDSRSTTSSVQLLRKPDDS